MYPIHSSMHAKILHKVHQQHLVYPVQLFNDQHQKQQQQRAEENQGKCKP